MTLGEQIIGFLESLPVPEGALVGQPMKLMDFQKRFILDVYDNPAHTKTAILSLARKNGKTALIAGLLLAHLVGPAAVLNSQIISGANTRDQASLVFKLAQKIINLSPTLQQFIRVIDSRKTLIGLPLNVEYRAIAADGRNAQGLSPILVIYDELGQVKGPQNDFFDALVTSQGAHENPLMICISTQAPTDADLLSVLIDDARTGEDSRTVAHVYEAPAECDVLDREAWAAANPALGVFRSMQDIADTAGRASRMPSQANTFRNLNLNQRIPMETPFLSREEWKACIADYDETPFLEGEVWGGLDLSQKRDLTALVLLAAYEGKFYVKAEVWTPKATLREREKTDRAPYSTWEKQAWLTATEGELVDFVWVATQLAWYSGRYNIKGVAYDRAMMALLEKELAAQNVTGINFIPWGQGFVSMTKAITALEDMVVTRTLQHGDNPLLNMSLANARVETDHAMNRRLTKQKSHGRIDPLVALAMAAGVCKSEMLKPKPKISVAVCDF